MSQWKVAQEIIDSVQRDNFILRRHAEERLAQRQFSKADVIQIAKTVIRWEWQEKKGSFIFVGTDLNDEGAGFTANRNEDGTYIITVFKRRIKKWEKKKS